MARRRRAGGREDASCGAGAGAGAGGAGRAPVARRPLGRGRGLGRGQTGAAPPPGREEAPAGQALGRKGKPRSPAEPPVPASHGRRARRQREGTPPPIPKGKRQVLFLNKMYSSSLKLKNKSMYKTEVRLPRPLASPAGAPGPPETAGPREGPEGRKRALLSSGARSREGAELGMHRLEGFRVPDWERAGRELGAPLNSVGSGLGCRGTEF